MLTTCPECRTSFRVSQPQLEARRGLVRCGHCRAVFNAFDTLLPEFETPEAAKAGTVPERIEAPVIPQPPELAELDEIGADESLRLRPSAQPDAAGAAPEEPVPYLSEAVEQDDEVPLFASAGGGDDEAYVLRMSDKVEVDEPQFEPPPAMPFAKEDPDAILLSELPTRSQIEPRKRVWPKFVFVIASVLLAVLLVAQTVYFLRGLLVDWVPELRPGFEAACQVLGCEIPLASEVGAIRIESSSLETDPEQPNRAILRVSFSNRSRLAQQWPHFVLKLTDWKGGAVAQRAFAPADYLPKGTAAQPGMAPMSEQEFRLDLDLTGLSASGYEVRPRYP
jgi:predicted Zn finger-like uncharacterized protein